MKNIWPLFFGCLVLSSIALADSEVINQLNFFYGQSFITPEDVNTSARVSGLNEFSKINVFGIEADRDIAKFFNFGIRIDLKTARVTPSNSNSTGNYYGALTQVNYRGMLNFPVVSQERFKAGGFIGIGFNKTSYTVKSASEEATLENTQGTPTALVGLSVAYGYKYVFFKVEGGYDFNKVGDLTKVGNMNTNVNSISLSGGYVSVGILIDGLKLGKM